MNKKHAFLLLLTNCIILNALIVGNFLQKWPYIGHDYSYFIPRLLDTHKYIVRNGYSIQWYTPSFGGGLPAYSNPQHIQYSVIQLFLFLTNPLNAIVLSTVFYLLFGSIAAYLLFSRVFKFIPASSVLGAIFFFANGFFLQRVAVGHLGYQTFPLLPVLLWVLLDKSIPRRISAIIIALTLTIIIHQAGFYLLISIALSLMISLPLIYYYNATLIDRKRVIIVLAAGFVIAFLLSFSKLTAIYSFMRFFPRILSTAYEASYIQGVAGIFLQLLGSMNLVPLFIVTGLDLSELSVRMASVSGIEYGLWEFDMSLAPIVWIIIIVGLDNHIHQVIKFPHRYLSKDRLVLLSALIAFTFITIEFILGKGLIFPLLEHLPILSSMHVRVRFTSAFIFPVCFAAAAFLNSWMMRWSEKKIRIITILVNSLTISSLFIYFLPQIVDQQYRAYNAKASYKVYENIQIGKVGSVTNIISADDTSTMLKMGSNLNLYEPIFGYSLEEFKPEVQLGSIWVITDGFFNISNPSGYVFPDENHSRPFERIRVDDEENARAFTQFLQPNWEIATYQHISNVISGVSLVCILGYLFIQTSIILLFRWKHSR